MPVYETLLVFVGIPAGIIFLIWLGVYGRSLMQQPNRYRPGKPWDYAPSWYVPHPEAVVGSSVGAGSTTTAVGGASGEW